MPAKPPMACFKVIEDSYLGSTCSEMYQCGLFKGVSLDQVSHARGVLIVNGAFSVEKQGEPEEGEVRATRFILNLVPSNSYLKPLFGGG